MTFRKSSFDKPTPVALNIFRTTLKKNIGISGIYSLLLLIFLPLSTLYGGLVTLKNTASQVAVEKSTMLSTTSTAYVTRGLIGSGMSYITILLIALYCVFTALLVFNYLHSKKAVDLYHSLPISRTALFFSKYLAGFTMIFVPLAVNMGLTALIQWILYKPNYTAQNTISGFTYITTLLLILICVYTMTAFIAVNTGTTFDAIITLLALNIGWVILVSAMQTLLTGLLIGFTQNITSYIYIVFSPLSTLFNYVNSFNRTGQSLFVSIAILAVVSALYLLGAVLVYKKRKSDHSGRVFSYSYVKHFIRLIASLAAGVTTAVSLSSQEITTKDAVFSFACGFIIISFVSYLVIYAISSRTFKGFAKSLVVYGAAVVVVALVYCGVGFDVFGYQTAVPELSEIKSVTATGNSNYSYSYSSSLYKSSGRVQNNLDKTHYGNKESINAFWGLHIDIADSIKKDKSHLFVLKSNPIGIPNPNLALSYNQLREGNPQKRYSSSDVQTNYIFENQITLTYHLKNGLDFTRTYSLQEGAFRRGLNNIYFTQEYRKNMNPLFSVSASQYNRCVVADDYTDVLNDITKEQAQKIIESLREESVISPGIKQEPYKNPVCTLLFTNNVIKYDDYNDEYSKLYADPSYGNYEMQFAIYPNYVNTIKLIEKYTKKSYDAFPAGTKAVLCNYLTLGLWNGFNYNMADNYNVLDFNIVSDPEKIQQLRDSTVRYCNAEVMTSGFFLQYYYPDGTRSQLFYCWGNDIPSFFYELNFKKLSYEDVVDFIN